MHNEAIDLIEKEIICDGLETLNKQIFDANNFILYVNIRSLNANYEKLQLLVESLKTKPMLIVCSETWNL